MEQPHRGTALRARPWVSPVSGQCTLWSETAAYWESLGEVACLSWPQAPAVWQHNHAHQNRELGDQMSQMRSAQAALLALVLDLRCAGLAGGKADKPVAAGRRLTWTACPSPSACASLRLVCA